MVKLSAGRDLDTTIKFNASTGEEYFHWWIACDTSKLESASYSEQKNLRWHITSAECTEKNLHEGGFDQYLRTPNYLQISK